jgi:hypothetical protein
MSEYEMSANSSSTDNRPSGPTFRFYEELNDFLSPELRRSPFLHGFSGTPSVTRFAKLRVPRTRSERFRPTAYSFLNRRSEVRGRRSRQALRQLRCLANPLGGARATRSDQAPVVLGGLGKVRSPLRSDVSIARALRSSRQRREVRQAVGSFRMNDPTVGEDPNSGVLCEAIEDRGEAVFHQHKHAE